MHSDRTQKTGLTERCRSLRTSCRNTGAWASASDSIEQDFRAVLIPNLTGSRPTQQADLTGTKIPCFQAPYNTQYFLVWNQPVAAESENRLQQLKIIFACPEKAGAKMATLSPFCASLLYGVFSGPTQIQDAASMANPEV